MSKVEASKDHLDTQLRESLIQKRGKIFSKAITKKLGDDYTEFCEERNLEPEDLSEATHWPSEFNIEDIRAVPDIECKALKEQPKFNRGTSINDFIHQNDNKSQW